MFVRLAEENQPGAVYAVHKGGFCFRVVIDQRISVRTALQRGLNQLFIPVQRQAEQLNEENRNGAEKGKKDNAQSFHPDDHGIDEQAQDYGQDDAQQGVALFQLGRERLKIIVAIQLYHLITLSRIHNSEFRIQN